VPTKSEGEHTPISLDNLEMGVAHLNNLEVGTWYYLTFNTGIEFTMVGRFVQYTTYGDLMLDDCYNFNTLKKLYTQVIDRKLITSIKSYINQKKELVESCANISSSKMFGEKISPVPSNYRKNNMIDKIPDFEIFKLENILNSMSPNATIGEARALQRSMRQDYLKWAQKEEVTYETK
jgi:hypothetical protein